MTASNTKTRKGKARQFENEVRASILGHFSMLGENDVISRTMGESGEDIILSPKAQLYLPLAIECKRQEKINIYAAYRQAEAHAKKTGLMAAVAHRRNNEDPLVTMGLSDLLAWIARLCEGGARN
jgi:hypothetical protein